MNRLALLGCIAAASLAVYACSAAKDQTVFTTGTGGEGGMPSASSTASSGGTASSSSATGSGQGGGIHFDGGPTGSGGGPPDCTDAAKLIYIVGEGNELYSFDPPTKAVVQVGTINCPQMGGFATPFSMAVDRTATAWVLFNDGNIYNVDTVTAACKATGFVPNQDPNFMTFGMGFVANMPNQPDETLYVASYTGTGIATIDTKTLKLTPVGAYDALNGPAEMTGTGDARLFGFFYQQFQPNAPPIIAEIDKTSSHIMSQAVQNGITIGSGWAFAFWGGEFYLFTAPTGKSRVDKYSPMTQMTTQVLPAIGLSVIVGAGVSTCAPIVPPN